MRLALPASSGDPSAERWRLVSALLVWCVLTAAFATANFAAWQRVKPPSMGSVTMAHVREARAFSA